jgi:hypothetical protein
LGQPSTALKIALFSENGDISFYEDTGSVQKFFWDASTERLGIGTSLPSRQIHLASSVPSLRLEDTDVSGLYGEIVQLATGDLSFRTDHGNVQASSSMSFSVDGSERMRINSSGDVGIGTTSPAFPLHVETAGNSVAFFKSTTTNSNIVFIDGSATANVTVGSVDNGQFRIQLNNAERMRIDSSGNVGIGTTSPSAKLEVAGDVKLGAVNPMQTATNVVHGTSGQNGFSIRTAVSGATTPTYSNIDDTNTGIL